MAQIINEEQEQLNWRDERWLGGFFVDFDEELRLCENQNLEPDIQNTEIYNETRARCRFIFNYYISRLEVIVGEIENSRPSREIVDSLRIYLERIILHPIFEGIVDQVSEEVLADFNRVNPNVTNPMLEGNNQQWSEISLVNNFNKIYGLYMRIIRYLNNMNHAGGRKHKYIKKIKSKKNRNSIREKKRKSINIKKSRKNRKL